MPKMNLDLKQVQKLMMTQELRQSIELLAINTADLGQIVSELASSNPLIELEMPEHGSIDQDKDLARQKEELLSEISKYDYPSGPSDYSAEEKDSPLDYYSQDSSTYDDLVFQLSLVAESERDLVIGKYILSSLDSRGFLKIDIEEIAKLTNSSPEKVEEIRKLIMDLDPEGVGSLNFKEFLLRQAKEDKLLCQIIENHLEDVGENRVKKIASDLGLSLEESSSKLAELKSLNPFPVTDFHADSQLKHVYPEADIVKVDGAYQVRIENEYIPKIHLTQNYKNMVRDADKETLKYLKEQMSSAKWLVDSIGQRESSIRIVLEALVDIQKDFLDHGKDQLKALSQKDLADKTGLSESTISRIVNDKFVNTPQGLVEIKDFFTGSSTGDASVSYIHERIKDLIDQEDKKKPLSDSKIENLLKEEDIKISRRTVAKYREELGIRSSSKRKEY